MLALLSQIPAAQAEDTDRPHQATFVPYRSPHIREVDPSLYLTNPAALGGAQLFYAIPSDDDGYTHPSSLLGDSLMMIYPYNGKNRVCSCRDRKFICVDAANTLSVLTKIMGFPSTVQRVNIIAWHLNESTKKILSLSTLL